MNTIRVKSANSKGYEEAHDGDSINLTRPDSMTRRGRVGHQIAQTLDTGGAARWVYSRKEQYAN